MLTEATATALLIENTEASEHNKITIVIDLFVSGN